MKAIVLAGGYAKRLWPLTKELAKPLVDINRKPIISYIIEKLDASQYIDEIIVSTNAKFEQDFHVWLDSIKHSKPIKVVVEQTKSEEEKLGAIGGLNFIIEHQKIDGDLFVIGGDNLTSIDIDKMIEYFTRKKCPIVAVYDIKDMESVKKFAEVTHDKEGKILYFREKPERPKTTLISTCCYVFPKKIFSDIRTYIDSGNNKDAPGFFIEWLSKKKDVFAHVFDDYWFDIGDHETLEKARKFAKENL